MLEYGEQYAGAMENENGKGMSFEGAEDCRK